MNNKMENECNSGKNILKNKKFFDKKMQKLIKSFSCLIDTATGL